MAFNSNRFGISTTTSSIGSYIHIGIYRIRVSILISVFVNHWAHGWPHWESRLEVNKFLLFISRYRVGLFRRLREAATEKDIHKAAREVIALVCTLKCIYLFLHFVLCNKLEQFLIQYFSLHWSLDVGCFWINVAWIWGWRMGKYSGWGTCFTGLLPWSRSNRLLPVGWKLHTKETKSYSFSSRQISI